LSDSDHAGSAARVALSEEETLDAIERAAELWGASWHRDGPGGRLELPVVAGLRRGTVTARLATDSDRDQEGPGTLVSARVEASEYRLQTAAVAILSVGGFGALALALWPLYPPLLALAPLALIFTVVAWLAVASRLQNSGIEEFLELVQTAADGPQPSEDPR
jgi:hypothetical protein